MDLALKKKKGSLQINLVPLLDSIFILVFFFMFAMVNMSYTQRLKLNLPVTSSKSSIGNKDKLPMVSIQGDGSIYFGDDKTDLKSLEAQFLGMGSEEIEKGVIVRGDSQADFGTIVQVLDIAKKANIKNIKIETKKN